jgi:hypothetical protein
LAHINLGERRIQLEVEVETGSEAGIKTLALLLVAGQERTERVTEAEDGPGATGVQQQGDALVVAHGQPEALGAQGEEKGL